MNLPKLSLLKDQLTFVDPLSSIVVVPISSLSNSVVTDNVCVSWAKLVASVLSKLVSIKVNEVDWIAMSVVVLISSVFIGVACDVLPFAVCVAIEVCCSIVTLSGS